MQPSWPHAPPHDVFAPGIYMVTGGTYQKAHFLRGDVRLNYFCETLFPLAEKYGWSLQAWAVLSNHYHFIAKSPDEGKQSLRPLITALHRRTAIYLNEIDGTSGRKVWHNYFDTPLTYQRSYYARLNYVNNNAVKHGLVDRAVDYPWCSAAWFESKAEKSYVRTIGAFKTDSVKVDDDY
jgi:putative transposase